MTRPIPKFPILGPTQHNYIYVAFVVTIAHQSNRTIHPFPRSPLLIVIQKEKKKNPIEPFPSTKIPEITVTVWRTGGLNLKETQNEI